MLCEMLDKSVFLEKTLTIPHRTVVPLDEYSRAVGRDFARRGKRPGAVREDALDTTQTGESPKNNV
jgi:hypothetical protein